jgi:hypothetical protein
VVSGLGLRFRERVSAECCEQSSGGWVGPVPLGEVGADIPGGLRGDLEVAHVGVAGEGEAGHQGDADPGADEGAGEAVVAGAAGDTGMEAADGSEHIQDAADLAPAVDPAFAGELGQADGRPAGQRVARRDQQPEVVSDQRGVAARSGGGRPGARRGGVWKWENGATLTEHSPPRVAIRAGSCRPMTSKAAASCSKTTLASMPSRSARPSSDIVTGTVAVGPSCGARAASSTAEPTAYPRRATSKGNSGQQIFEWFVGGQDVHIYERYQDSAASLARRRPSLHRENQLGRPAWSNRSSRLGLRWC